jgi:acetyl-CoA C-acetyltransferase
LKLAYSLVKSGLHDAVMVIGFQIMSQLSSEESQERMGRGADIQWESPFGTMMPAYYAMHAQAHMAAFGTTLEDLALIRVKAATYGQLNEKGVYRKPVALEQFTDSENIFSQPVATPLRTGDCCANADGSSCIIVASEEKAKALSKKAVWILGLGASSSAVNMSGRDLFSGLMVAQQAAEEAYKMAGISDPKKQIDLFEIDDWFSYKELQHLESIGICDKGEAGKLLEQGMFDRNGDIPVNVSGGRLGAGNLLEGSSLQSVLECALQIRGHAGKRQLKDVKTAVAQSWRGVPTATGSMVVLGSDK